MKKIIFFTLSCLLLTTFAVAQQQTGRATRPARTAAKKAVIQPGTNIVNGSYGECRAEFTAVLNSSSDPSLALFEKSAEKFLKNSHLWQNCLRPSLDMEQNAIIDFVVLLDGGAVPTEQEMQRATKAALALRAEMEDYIENYQEDTGFYEEPERFINIDLGIHMPAEKTFKKAFKKEMKGYKKGGKEPKVIITVGYASAPAPARAGNAAVSVR